MFKRWAIVLAVLMLCVGLPAFAQGAPATELPPGLQIPDAARPGPGFDVDRATAAYLDLLSPEQRAQSDAYFEGGYWLRLWNVVYGIIVAAVLVLTGLSRRMRDFARRLSRRPWMQAWWYALQWIIVGSLLGLPWSIYSDFVREHAYGLSTQTFGAWLGDQGKGLIVGLIVTPLLIALLYAAIRRAGARWWVWASGGTFAVLLVVLMLGPVFIDPLFNQYKPLREGPVREAILSLARANQIPTDNVVEFDASRQTTRISANVAGLGATIRVALNDNLLDRTSEPEIKAVMGHEMGHYVLNHAVRLVVYLTLVFGLGFWVVHRVFDAVLARRGRAWGFEGRADPAALPVAVAILSVFFLLVTPLTNSIVRQAEAEADAFGLNAAREPHGFAMVAMRLSTYRKLAPGPIEEIVFYDHPSGYARVHRAMTWLKENLDNPTANTATPVPAPPATAPTP